MYELVHRHAPESPIGRTLLAVAAALIGVPGFLIGVAGSANGAVGGIALFLISIPLLVVATQLTRGVVHQANAAPESNPAAEFGADETTVTPVETLRDRYANGEMSDAEFQRRLDQLLETEDFERSQRERERITE